MKKRIIRLVALFSCFLLLAAFMVPASAQGAVPEVGAYVEASGTPMAAEKSVEEQAYRQMKRDYHRVGKTARQADAMLLDELGVATSKDGEMYQRMLDAMATADSVRMVTQYVKSDADGSQTALTKAACMREVAEEQEAQLSAAQPGIAPRSPQLGMDSVGKVSENGYMALGILYVRTGVTYNFFGVAEWLIMPALRVTDAISLYCDEVSWHNQVEGNYGVELEYEYKTIEMGRESVVSGTSMYSYASANLYPGGGFYYKIVPPADISTSSYTKQYRKMSYTIAGKGDLKNNNVNSFNVFLRYAHRQLVIKLDFGIGWSTGENPGATLNVYISSEAKYYDIPIQVK